jgi:DNA-binding NtrC family response regulator
VRLICATNRNLADDVKHGRFREDLFFRLNVFPVTIPPLRARREDVDALTEFFLLKFARELHKRELTITADARARLREYPWPGNIRELENCIERAAILCNDSRIQSADLHLGGEATQTPLGEMFDLSGTLAEATERVGRSIEKAKITEALARTTSRNDAAELLGISARTLASKMKEYGIESPES